MSSKNTPKPPSHAVQSEICSKGSRTCCGDLPPHKRSSIGERHLATNSSNLNGLARPAARSPLVRRVLQPPRDPNNMGPEIIEWANEALQENHVVILGQDLNAPGPDVWMTSFSWPLGDEKATFAAYGLASVFYFAPCSWLQCRRLAVSRYYMLTAAAAAHLSLSPRPLGYT